MDNAEVIAEAKKERHALHQYLVLSYWLTILLFILPEALFAGTYFYSKVTPEFDLWSTIPVNNALMLFFLLMYAKPLILLQLQHLCAITFDIPVKLKTWRLSKRFFWAIMLVDILLLCFLFYIANHWAE